MVKLREWFSNKNDEILVSMENAYNSINDSDKSKIVVSSDEMSKVLEWVKKGIHKLMRLNIIDENGDDFDTIDDLDNETDLELKEVLNHNIILLYNNWAQTMNFQDDENGKDVVEGKYNPIDNQNETSQELPTRTAQVSYNIFDINQKADKNLEQVSKIIERVKSEYEQYLDIYTS